MGVYRPASFLVLGWPFRPAPPPYRAHSGRLEDEKPPSRAIERRRAGYGSTSAASRCRPSVGCARARPTESADLDALAGRWYTKGVSFKDDNRDPVVTVRMPEELLADLERLRPLLQQLPEYREDTLTRSMLVRLAVAHGLERLRAVLKERVDDELQVDLLEPKQHTLLGDE